MLRKKETEEDYGYILDSDLVKTEITKEMVDRVKEGMPELAHEKARKFVGRHKIRKEDAEIISSEKELAEMFEKVSEEIDLFWLRNG